MLLKEDTQVSCVRVGFGVRWYCLHVYLTKKNTLTILSCVIKQVKSDVNTSKEIQVGT